MKRRGVAAILCLAALGAVILWPTSKAIPPDPNLVIARFSGGEIRRSDIAEALRRRLASAPALTPEVHRLMVRRVVERRVRVAMLLAEAKANGFDESPSARLASTAAADRILAQDLIASDTASARAADGLVADALERRLQTLERGEARKFSHIYLRAQVTDTAARKAAEAKMQRLLDELKGGAGFNTLAERHSDSVDARGGGRVEWTLRKDLRPSAGGVIFAMREGEVSAVDATTDGLHLYRLDGIRGGSPIDVDALRRAVRKELDDEARATSEHASRQEALDAAAAEFAPPNRLAPSMSSADPWVARWNGGQVRASQLQPLLRAGGIELSKSARFVRQLVENRLLALRRRERGLTTALAEEVSTAQSDAVLDAYRATLIADADVRPTEEEVARYHRENSQSALFLRDHRLDILFFPQSGDSASDVYAAGEKVVAELRNGVSFERLLDRPPLPSAMVCRDTHHLDLEVLGQQMPRLRRAILGLDVGEVSAAIYFDARVTSLKRGDCLQAGRGVAFVRLREIRTLPLDRARGAIHDLLVQQKTRAAIDAIQARLISASGLEILVPEG